MLDGPIRAQVRALLQDAVEAATNADYPGCMVTIGMLSCGAEHRDLAETVAKLRAKYFQNISAFLVSAKVRGELQPSVDTQAAARYLVVLIQGIAVQARDGATPEELSEVVEVAVKFWPLVKSI